MRPILLLVWSVALVLTAASTLAQTCEYEQVYTECVNGERCLLEYAPGCPTECNPCSKDPVCNLPCDVHCEPGSHLDTTGECVQCAAGTFTPGGAVLYNEYNFESAFDTAFSHGCHVGSQICDPDLDQGWRVLQGSDGTSYLDSGVYHNLNNVDAKLFLSATLERPGHIGFRYRAEAEPRYDGMLFYIDGVLALPLQYSVHEVRYVEINVTAGSHTFEWVYHKDFSVTREPDHAHLLYVVVTGVSSYADSCDDCAPGFSTDGQTGQAVCHICPVNTFAPAPGGNPSCLPCPTGEVSDRGAATCRAADICTDDDAIATFGPCVLGSSVPGGGSVGEFVRVGVYAWREPISCDNTGVALPPDDIIECEPCNPGMVRNPVTAQCDACPPGQYRSDDDATCRPCTTPGTAAVRERYYEYFYEETLSSEFERSCVSEDDSECQYGGWVAMNAWVETGHGHGRVTMTLSLDVNIVDDHGAEVFFLWTTTCQYYSDCTLNFYIDDDEVTDVKYIYNSYYNDITVPITTPGAHTLTWVFRKLSDRSLDHYIQIDKIVVRGTASGGAGECLPCDDGYYTHTVPASFCTPCREGTTSSADKATCTPCPRSYYAPVQGSPECYQCGQGTDTTVPEATDCDYHGCRWAVPDEVSIIEYDLGPLSLDDGDWGPVPDSFRPSFTYYVNLCNRYHNNTMCRDHKAGKSLETFVCQVTETEAINMGEILGFYKHPVDAKTGLTIRFTEGADEGCPRPRETTLTMTCDPNLLPGTPSAVVEEPPASCSYHFEWRTAYACYLCTDKDYDVIKGECEGGEQTITHRWIEPKLCLRGAALPMDYSADCSGKGGSSSTTGIAIASAIAVGASALLGILCYQYYRLRQRSRAWDLARQQDGNQGAGQYRQFEDDNKGGAAAAT